MNESGLLDDVDHMDDTATEDDPDECPVCGQPYVHKRTVNGDGGLDGLRDDMSYCTRKRVDDSLVGGETREVYVHE